MPTIKQLFSNYEFMRPIQISGWVQTTRSQKDMTFIKLNDGTHAEGIQVVVNNSNNKYTVGTSLEVRGQLVESPAQGQLFELVADEIIVLGMAEPSEYPLSKGKMSLDYLRNYQHLRARTNTFGCVFRIKSAISHATHRFYEEEGFLHLDPNILTINECEGGAGVFQVTEKDISIPSKLQLMTVEMKDENGKPTRKALSLRKWNC
jgi:asparaginyl-tRNA synthetase